jgi:hypothetical protein
VTLGGGNNIVKLVVLGVPVPLSVVDPDPDTTFEPKKPGLRGGENEYLV